MIQQLINSELAQKYASIRYCYLSMDSFCSGDRITAEAYYDKALEAAETERELYGTSFYSPSALLANMKDKTSE